MAKTFVIHDESLNSKGYWMLTSGCDLSQFEKNPIMLWNHNLGWSDARADKLPIGHWENIRVKGKQILADAVFDTDDFAQTIAQKVEAGTLRMASVGAVPVETSTEAKYAKPGQRFETVLKWKLREASLVNFGANSNALALSEVVLYDDESNILELSTDIKTSPLRELSNKDNTNMNAIAKLLNLSDDASEQAIIDTIRPLLNLSAENQTLKETNTTLQAKIDAIELAEKEVLKAEASTLIADAIKDGRLSEDTDGSATQFWLSAFEANHEAGKKQLASLPKRKSVGEGLSDDDPNKVGAWERRMKDIESKTGN